MGVLQGVGTEREPGADGYVKTQYLDPWAVRTPLVTRYGEVCGGGDQERTEDVHADCEAGKAESKEDKGKKGRWSMNVWANWLRPAPSYFDRITGIVEQLVELECDMRDGENAAHDTLHEIEAARREISVRIRRA